MFAAAAAGRCARSKARSTSPRRSTRRYASNRGGAARRRAFRRESARTRTHRTGGTHKHTQPHAITHMRATAQAHARTHTRTDLQAGLKIKGMKCLIRSGDTEKIMCAFATTSVPRPSGLTPCHICAATERAHPVPHLRRDSGTTRTCRGSARSTCSRQTTCRHAANKQTNKQTNTPRA